MSSEAAVGDRRFKSNQAANVARKSHDDYGKRRDAELFVGDDCDSNDCERDGDDWTSTEIVVINSPVLRNNSGNNASDHWQQPVRVTCAYGEKPRNDDAEDANAGDTVGGTALYGYHPVRRRFLVDGGRDETATAAAEDSSPEDQRRWWDKQQSYGNYCWRPKPSTLALDIHQHRHRRVNLHRHHHHHTHRLHMWTSSCCWWLLVFYAVVVLVASFARAAHSAKDGKYNDTIL